MSTRHRHCCDGERCPRCNQLRDLAIQYKIPHENGALGSNLLALLEHVIDLEEQLNESICQRVWYHNLKD